MNPFTHPKSQFFQTIGIFFVAILMGTTFIACDDDEPQPKPPSHFNNKIMPLGASRVEGARPDFESYRYELWKLLIEGGWEFDFIGTQTDNSDYDDFQASSFDKDHEGRGGWTSGQILDGLEGWLESNGEIDIVLFSSPGGNDILNRLSPYDQTISNINEIIDILQAKNPNVTIIIERLAPGMSSIMTPELTNDFNLMQEEVTKIANEQSTSSSQVITVDMVTGFNDSLLADDVHYNEAGAKFIADRYYEVLKGVLQQ
ncbi:MAG: GDSL-type esterase/lipase family protein [Bacteroidota bacterium]